MRLKLCVAYFLKLACGIMRRFPTAGRAQGFHAALVAGMLYRGEDLVLEDDEAVEAARRKERGEAAERENAILETAAKKKRQQGGGASAGQVRKRRSESGRGAEGG